MLPCAPLRLLGKRERLCHNGTQRVLRAAIESGIRLQPTTSGRFPMSNLRVLATDLEFPEGRS